MRTNKKFQNYHGKRWKEIVKNLRKYIRAADSEVLHQLRIEIKKLTALFHFVEYCTDEFESKKRLKPVIRLFKLSGEIRDYRNALLFCEKFGIKKSLFKHGKATHDASLKKMKSNHKKYSAQFKHLKKKTEHYLKYIKEKQRKNYLEKTEEEIKFSLTNNFAKNNLHELRKKIKEAIYLSKLTTPVEYSSFAKTTTAIFEKLQDEIGEWHDIHKFINRIKEQQMKTGAKKMLSTVKEEEQELLNKISKLSTQLLGPKVDIN